MQSNTGWCIIKSINTHITGACMATGKKQTTMINERCFQNQGWSSLTQAQPSVACGTGQENIPVAAVFCLVAGYRRHFWSTDLDLNEMKVADLQWERTGGDVESRLLLVRLLCLLAVGPHCWHISSVSDSTKLKMLGLSTDPISRWQGRRGFQRFRWRALSFSAQSHYGWVLLLYTTVCSNREPSAANRIKDQ